MKLLKFFLIFSIIISSCKPDEDKEPTVNLPKDYGQGMYILTDQGVSFYNYLAVDSLRVVTENIYKKVNNTDIIQPKSIHISGKQAYIIGDKVYVVDIETFESLGSISGFSDPASCVRVDNDRLYVVDKGASSVKIVDLSKLEVVWHIETGEGTQPINIVNNWFRAIVMNGGGDTKEERDSSIISIDYFTQDNYVVVNNSSGLLNLGYNPNSAVFGGAGGGDMWVLCKGIYDLQNPIDNAESSIFRVWPYDSLATYNNTIFNGIYNAHHLIKNYANTELFFIAEGGIYKTDWTMSPNNDIQNIEPDFLTLNREKINDSIFVEYIYTNDANQSGKVLKYEAWSGFPIDTITVSGNVLEVAFY